MSDRTGYKRKRSDSVLDFQSEQVSRRAKLETPKGQDCSCLSRALPPHIRQIIMTSESKPLKGLLKAYQRGLIIANIDLLWALHAPEPTVVFPNASDPADTEDEIRALYLHHLTNAIGIFSSPPQETTPKGKSKGRKTAETDPPSEAAPQAASDLSRVQVNVQEVSPLAEDWAFARVEFSARDSSVSRVWAWFLFRKMSLGVEEEMAGWRIARSIFTIPAPESEEGQAESGKSKQATDVRMGEGESASAAAAAQSTSPGLAKRQKPGHGRGKGSSGDGK